MDATSIANSPPAGQGAAEKSALGLADDFDSFLKLLTTQLTSQDPLQPMDANEFTAQLVQFSEVEQSIRTNDALEQLLALNQSDQFARGAAYLGMDVTASTAAIRVDASGVGQGSYSLADPATSVTIRVRNEAGQVVFEGPGGGEAGHHPVPWNGLDATGQRAPAGLYSIEVEATDASGQPIAVETAVSGVVDGVEFDSGGRLMLSIDGVLVPNHALVAAHLPSTDA